MRGTPRTHSFISRASWSPSENQDYFLSPQGNRESPPSPQPATSLPTRHLQFATLPWLALTWGPICYHSNLAQRNEAPMGGWQAVVSLFPVRGLPGLLTQWCGVGHLLVPEQTRPVFWWALWCALQALHLQPVNAKEDLRTPAQADWGTLIRRAPPLPGTPAPLHSHTQTLHSSLNNIIILTVTMTSCWVKYASPVLHYRWVCVTCFGQSDGSRLQVGNVLEWLVLTPCTFAIAICPGWSLVQGGREACDTDPDHL